MMNDYEEYDRQQLVRLLKKSHEDAVVVREKIRELEDKLWFWRYAAYILLCLLVFTITVVEIKL